MGGKRITDWGCGKARVEEGGPHEAGTESCKNERAVAEFYHAIQVLRRLCTTPSRNKNTVLYGSARNLVVMTVEVRTRAAIGFFRSSLFNRPTCLRGPRPDSKDTRAHFFSTLEDGR